jgi:2-polyprenyl-3-methyl-5-hydroxy-6-metoxy-1,4-benzoquinol methylase
MTATVPTGNTFDKYGSRNPVVRRLMGAFERDLAELFASAAPRSVLDVGCGEGILTSGWAQQNPGARVVGFDLEDPKLREHWAGASQPNLSFQTGDARELPFADREFDMVAAIETLEHIPDSERVVAEMARVAAHWLLVSVPREPLWRMLNVLRGAYVRELGNTPGHVNHWSATSFKQLLVRQGQLVQVRAPFPWTMLLVRVG